MARRPIPRAPRRNLQLYTGVQSAADGTDGEPLQLPNSRGTSAEYVELQIEVLSPFVVRLMLFMWYAVLIAAVIVESIDFVAWGVVNVCGEDVSDMRHYDLWDSPCARTEVENDTTALYTVHWEGRPYEENFFSDSMVRFVNVVFSLASPDDWDMTEEDIRKYELEAYVFGKADPQNGTKLPFPITCRRSSSRCEFAELKAEAVLIAAGGGKASVSLSGLPASLARGANSSSIGILFQKPKYVLGTFVWRYVFLVISFLHLVRFIVYKKYTCTLYEQSWVVALQLSLFWYLNPLSILTSTSQRPSFVLDFLEFHFPTWYMAMTIGFMFSVITASMRWASPLNPETQKHKLWSFIGIKEYLCQRSSICDPPMWTKIVAVLFIVVIILLDFIETVWHNILEFYGWKPWSRPMYYSIAALLVLGALICCGFLVHLHRNLGAKSYLFSRPQQIACRVFILVFGMAFIFHLFLIVMFFTRYNTIPGMVAPQPLIQLPAIMVETFLTNIMTLIYTTRNRSDLVPIHPRDERWKHMVWPDTWYRWIARHGGSMYIFHSEAEETLFNWNQCEFRHRQYMARIKRKYRGAAPPVHLRAMSQEVQGTTQNTNAESETVERAQTFADFRSPYGHTFLSSAPTMGDAHEFLNMDKTSTWFLPAHARRLTGESGCRSPNSRSFSMEIPTNRNTSAFTGAPSDTWQSGTNTPHQVLPHRTNLQTSMHYPDLLRSYYLTQQPNGGGGDGDGAARPSVEGGSAIGAWINPDNPLRRNDREMAGETERESDRLMRTLGRAQEMLGSIMRSAERNLITRPVYAFEQLETAILDAAQRPFQDIEYLPFFNLETAIDCFNLSWEAYGASYRPEGRMERRPLQPSVFRLCCCCCCCCCSASPSSLSFDSIVELPAASTVAMPVGSDGEGIDGDGAGETMGTEDSNAPPPINVEQYGYVLIAVLEAMDVQVIISLFDAQESGHEEKASRIVIAFRGTMNMSNAWQDLRVRRVVWDEMVEDEPESFRKLRCGWQPTVHVGFLSIWNAHREHIQRKLWGVLAAKPTTVYRIFCTGHSLGGALASLCAYSVRNMLRRKEYPLAEVTVYTFGQPPLGNSAFRKTYNKAVPRTFRVVNESDAVSLIGVYGCHVGIEVDIDRHGNCICKPTYMERLFRPIKGKGFAVENHLMSFYGTSLNALGEGTGCPISAFIGTGEACDNDGGGNGGSNGEAVPQAGS
ncbi:putative lipase domain protein [Trypanosoma grayi]|uniref:putative lipase domain protein n=1 Tax=Trypanosoma grayi TaxID=71804 RepID=UPI0004F435DB|nr:putative lipase domain protein [Trypanosoma grayi]KEG14689.1 putative lipase domain protein [Trypanosoma grayi]